MDPGSDQSPEVGSGAGGTDWRPGALRIGGVLVVVLLAFLAGRSLGERRAPSGAVGDDGDESATSEVVEDANGPVLAPMPTATGPRRFPDARSAGPLPGVELRIVPDAQEWVVTEDVSGVDFSGMIVIGAPNVTISNSRIRPTNDLYGVWNRDGFANASVENVEIVCGGDESAPVAAAGIAGVQRVRSSDISGCADGIKIGSGARVEANFIHDLSQADGLHSDGIQMTNGSDVVISNNTIVTIDDDEPSANAAVFIQSDAGPISDVHIVGNSVDGFGFSIRVSGDRVTGTRVERNVIGPNHLFGPMLIGAGAERPDAGNEESGNSRPDGTPLRAQFD